MKRPDIGAMIRARAEIDEHLNKILVLLAPSPGAPAEDADAAAVLVSARVLSANRALIRFADACMPRPS